jgi:hypothetical protein
MICEHCGYLTTYSDAELELSGLNPADWRGFQFREGRSCIECGGTGYRGRTAIHELLDLTDLIREMILEKKPSSEVRKLAAQEGLHFLMDSALDRRAPRTHHTEGNQQGHLHRGQPLSDPKLQKLDRLEVERSARAQDRLQDMVNPIATRFAEVSYPRDRSRQRPFQCGIALESPRSPVLGRLELLFV